MRLDFRPLSVATVIDSALDGTVRPTAVEKGVHPRVDVDPRAGPIMGDPDRFQQVIWNLLSTR